MALAEMGQSLVRMVCPQGLRGADRRPVRALLLRRIHHGAEQPQARVLARLALAETGPPLVRVLRRRDLREGNRSPAGTPVVGRASRGPEQPQARVLV